MMGYLLHARATEQNSESRTRGLDLGRAMGNSGVLMKRGERFCKGRSLLDRQGQ